jgi:hypothetical protein
MSKLLLKFRNLTGEVKNKKRTIKLSFLYIINKIKITSINTKKDFPKKVFLFLYIKLFFQHIWLPQL